MWLYRTGGSKHQIVLMIINRTEAYPPRSFLEGFKGYLHADAMRATMFHENILLWVVGSSSAKIRCP